MAHRTLAMVERDVDAAIIAATSMFRGAYAKPDRRRIWVLKFFPPRFLDAFLQSGQLLVSTSPGFTWGDAVYVTPLAHPTASMMYGRIGVLGWIAEDRIRRVFDATQSASIALYQEWIFFQAGLYELLTTTCHGDFANRLLRNDFRRRFSIDVVLFVPDQTHPTYVDPRLDRWLAVTEPLSLQANALTASPTRSTLVQDCEWVAVVGEEFETDPTRLFFRDLMGRHLQRAVTTTAAARSPSRTLSQALLAAYRGTRRGRRTIAFVEP